MLSALPRWAESIMQSPWTYIILIAVFLCIMSVALVLLVKKPTPTGAGAIQEDELTARILAIKDSPRKVLLAAAGLDCMPVTVPIRTAINLAAADKKCLLIDLDTRRDAVARVFNIPAKNPPSFEPVSTDVENIHVIAAHVFGGTQNMNIQAIARAAEKKYEIILINAPYLDGHPDRRQIAGAARHAILFAQTTPQLDRLQGICKTARCRLIGSYRTVGKPSTANIAVL